jgi:predicted HTH transcriptional regulator
MECNICKDSIPEGDECKHNGKVICEDCYIESLSPPKTCDVAAVHAAKKHRAALGQSGTEGLTEQQKEIVNYINEHDKITKQDIAEKFELKPYELDRQFAILRHCELVKGKKVGDNVYIVPFDAE